jgi:dolichol-phosphate mannosyltransferase
MPDHQTTMAAAPPQARAAALNTVGEWFRHVRHLRRLFVRRYGTRAHLAQFLVVGASGVAVNLAVLTLALGLGAAEPAAVMAGIAVSLGSNFALNRRFTFSYARGDSLGRQFLGFVLACSAGVVVNSCSTLLLRPYLASVQAAALLGILAGTAFNFLCLRFLVFRRRAVSVPVVGSCGSCQ